MENRFQSISEPEWRSKALNERLAFVYTNKLFTDVTLGVFLGGKEHIFMAHKNILAYYSPVLEKIFYGNGSQHLHHTVLQDVDPQGVAYVLKTLYHVPPSPRKDIDRSVLISAYHAAKTLAIHGIAVDIRSEILTEVLTNSLIPRDDFWKILELSRILRLDDIRNRLLRFAESNSKAVLRAKSLPKASPCTLKTVLDLDMLKTSEGEVLDAIMRWKEGNSNLPFLDEFLQDLLNCVRIRNLTSMDLCQFAANKSDLISRKDVLKIIMHNVDPTSASLPVWCSKKSRSSIAASLPKADSTGTQKVESSSAFLEHSEESKPKFIPSSNLLFMYLEQNYTDVCFVVGNEKKQIKAHRNILAIGSMTFEKMFYSPVADCRTCIDVPGHDLKGFEYMLMYFYDDTRNDSFLKRNRIIHNVYQSNTKYGSWNLMKACLTIYTPEQITRRSFWKKLHAAIKQKDPVVLRQFSDFASKNTGSILNCPGFLDASQEAVSSVLALDTLNVEEIEVLQSAANWLKKNVGKPEVSKYDTLRFIRFGNIRSEDFSAFSKKHADILPEDEVLCILLHIHDKESTLPAWCHNGLPRRSYLPYENDPGQ